MVDLVQEVFNNDNGCDYIYSDDGVIPAFLIGPVYLFRHNSSGKNLLITVQVPGRRGASFQPVTVLFILLKRKHEKAELFMQRKIIAAENIADIVAKSRKKFSMLEGWR